MQLIDYFASNDIAKVRFHASEMIMIIHSDASYLSAPGARSRTCGHFFMGWTPKDNEPIKLNRAFHTNTTIMWYVVALAAETELGALFHNCQTAIVFWQTLANLGHPQPKTPVHCDYATAVGIANNTVKCQRSRSMEMRYFWVGDKETQEIFELLWHLGLENLADYQSKHHAGSHHAAVRPYYLYMENSPRILPRALWPSTLKGCVCVLTWSPARGGRLPY